MAKDILPMKSEETSDMMISSQNTNTQGQGLLRMPLQQQEQQHQSQHLPGDCLPCKIIGSAGFGGLGLYSFYQAQQLPKNLVSRRIGLGLIGTACIGASLYRLSMPINNQEPPSTSDV
ncbi:hypothetical protein BGZ76_001664 [Entomortierella beljakovae]|nr:hypothetical protein BGZ76_001664 [Entomortierella beljakovae]